MQRLTLILALLPIACMGGRAAAPETAPAPAVAQLADVPMSIVLEGSLDPEGRWALRATIHVSAGVSVPPVVRVLLPAGAQLVSGNAQETLPAPGVDATHIRRFLIAGADAPVRVVAGVIAGGAGVTVAAQWPAREAAPRSSFPTAEPLPPTPVRDVPVDQAVPLD